MAHSRASHGHLAELFDRVERVGPEACRSTEADELRLKLALLIAGDVAADREPPLSSDQRHNLEVALADAAFDAMSRVPVPAP